MLVALEWRSCPYLVVQAFMRLDLVPDVPDSVGEDGDGLFPLRLVREDARRVWCGPVEREVSHRARLPRDAHWRVSLSDGAQFDFGEDLGSFPVSERAADEPEDFTDEEEPVHREDVSRDDWSDDDGYKGGRVVAERELERRSTFAGGSPFVCLRSGLLVALRASTGKRALPILGGRQLLDLACGGAAGVGDACEMEKGIRIKPAIGLISIPLSVRE
jgi:hypothetical protein